MALQKMLYVYLPVLYNMCKPCERQILILRGNATTENSPQLTTYVWQIEVQYIHKFTGCGICRDADSNRLSVGYSASAYDLSLKSGA